MREDLLKRNTDCVYFLASPLTCKKGLDCEYRHSEVARLNPRDCWYWLAGNCLNPTCGFRHPPLEGLAEPSSKSAPLPHQCPVPVNKISVPCYFYFNGFCNKGDRCSFFHEVDGNTPGKPSKTASSVPDALLPSENKLPAGDEILSAPIEAHVNESENVTKTIVDQKFWPKEDIQRLAPKNILQCNVTLQNAVFECKDTAIVKPDCLSPAEGFIQSKSPLCSDQSSEEPVDEHIEPEERWESSPGFDVLVDDKFEKMVYENEPEYVLTLNREQTELNSSFLGYDLEDTVECDPMYSDVELLYGHEIYDSFDNLDDEHIFDNVRKISGHSRERMLDSILSEKRKILATELALDDRWGVDLRDHLRKRRIIDGQPISRLPSRHDPSHLIGRGRERARRHRMSRRLLGRLSSEVVDNAIDLFGENASFSNGSNKHGWSRHSLLNRSRQRYKENRRARCNFLSYEVSRKPFSRENWSPQASTAFTGPKTLAQIKEEKKIVEENGDSLGKMGYSRRTSADFQGPKPLSEILRHKRLDYVRDDNGSRS